MRTRHRQAVEIHPRSRRPPQRIRTIPARHICPGCLLAIHQRRHPLTQEVEHLQPHWRRRGQLIGNERRRIERIGIVLPQPHLLRQRQRPIRRRQW